MQTTVKECDNGDVILLVEEKLQHIGLRERAAVYGGQLNLSEEMTREEPVGTEVW